jgi:hypothetical protein
VKPAAEPNGMMLDNIFKNKPHKSFEYQKRKENNGIYEKTQREEEAKRKKQESFDKVHNEGGIFLMR